MEPPHLRQIRRSDGAIPRYLFRGFNRYSGGNAALNTEFHVMPHAFDDCSWTADWKVAETFARRGPGSYIGVLDTALRPSQNAILHTPVLYEVGLIEKHNFYPSEYLVYGPPGSKQSTAIEEAVLGLSRVISKAAKDSNVVLPLVNPKTYTYSLPRVRLMIKFLQRVELEIIMVRNMPPR
ncbi:hypothetical protein F5883DRAFT_521613 [Diaporthe sp. PMI_573]|nr:hypothetical protein F5883DRAFT_521613 [Diaporthaceae sp. PMI_573]